MIEKLSKTAAIRRRTLAVAHKTPTIPRETVTVSSATPAVLGHTPDVPGATPTVPGATPTVPAATPAIVARNAWYTARMQWIRNAHRHTKTRWTLTVLAAVFLVGWILSGWFLVEWVSPRLSYVLISDGELSLRKGWAPPEQWHARAEAGWNPNPLGRSWLSIFGLWDHQGIGVSCSLDVLTLAALAPAGFLWYRRWRPNNQSAHARSRRLAILRWTFSAVVAALTLVSLVSYKFPATYADEVDKVVVTEARIIVNSPPNSSHSGTEDFEKGLILGETRILWPIYPDEYFNLEFRAFPCYMDVSTWFLAFLVSIPAGLFWYAHLRKDPVGLCPDCCYDLTGLAADTPCPECGHTSNAPRSAAT